MQLWEYCALRETEQGIVYTLYQDRRYTITLISQGKNLEDTSAIFASYSTRLGLLGWKTVESTLSDDGTAHAHFRRTPGMEQRELNIVDLPVKDKGAATGSCKNLPRPLASARKGRLLLNPASNDVKVHP